MLIRKLGELLIENRLITPEQLDEALHEQEMRTREFQLLRSISRKISAGMPLEELLAAVAEETRALLEVETVRIYLLEEYRNIFLQRYPDPRYRTESLLAPSDDPVIAPMLASKNVHFVADVPACAEGRGCFCSEEVCSAVFVPFLVGQDVVGFMLLGDGKPFHLGEDDAALLQLIGSQVGISIRQSKYLTSRNRIGDFLLQSGRISHDALTDALNEQQNALNKLVLLQRFNLALSGAVGCEDVLNLLADTLARTLDVRRLVIFISDPETERYFPACVRGMDPILGGAFEFAFDHPLFNELESWMEPVYIDAPAAIPNLTEHPMMDGAVGAIAVPIPAAKVLAGVAFAVLSEHRETDVAEMNLAAAYASLAGPLLESHYTVQEKNRLGNVLLRRGSISRDMLDEVLMEQEAYASVTDYLTATSRRISRMLAVDEMCEAVGEEAAKLLRNDNVFIFLGDRERESFVRILDMAEESDTGIFMSDLSGRSLQEIPFAHPLAQRLFGSHEAMYCENAAACDELKGVFTAQGLISSVVIPMTAKNTVVGFLLAAGDAGWRVSDENISLLFTLLSDVSVAIETMRITAEKRKLGHILIERGAIAEENLKKALKKQLE